MSVCSPAPDGICSPVAGGLMCSRRTSRELGCWGHAVALFSLDADGFVWVCLRLYPGVPTWAIVGRRDRCVVLAAMGAAIASVLLRCGGSVHLSVLVVFGVRGAWTVCRDGDAGATCDGMAQDDLDGGTVEVGRRADRALARAPPGAGREGREFACEIVVPFVEDRPMIPVGLFPPEDPVGEPTPDEGPVS